MEKSIEKIWNDSFMNTNELLIPKINNLYNQKSKFLLEKIKKTYTTDNKSLIPIAIIFCIGFSLFGHIILGIYGMTLMIALYFKNKKMLNSLEGINIYTNSYEYLITYRDRIKRITTSSTKLLGFGFPITFIPGYWLFFRETKIYTEIITKIDATQLLLLIIGFTILLSALSILIYKPEFD